MKVLEIFIVGAMLAGATYEGARATDLVRHCVTVRQHEELSRKLSEARVDEILKRLSEFLQAQDSNADVPCSVELERCGNVGTFSSEEIPLKIEYPAHFDKLREGEGSIKVVGAITWCGLGNVGLGFLGCSDIGGPAMAVIPYQADQEPILWAHEFAHNTGSPDVYGEPTALMYWQIGVDHREVNEDECNRLLQGSLALNAAAPAQAPATGTLSGAVAAEQVTRDGAPIAPVASSAMTGTGSREPIEAFVGKSFYHGVPYNQAKLYSDEDVPVLEEVLNDRSKEDAWITAVGTLAGC